MKLPPGIGRPDVLPAELLRQSLALGDPLGRPTLVIEPETYGQMSERKISASVAVRLSRFFNKAGKGNGADLESLKRQSNWIAPTVARSAADRNYADAHCWYPDAVNGEAPLCSVVIAPRRNVEFRKTVATYLNTPAASLSLPDVDPAEYQFLGLWHEYAHTAGANEPQADTLAAVMFTKAFPDKARATLTAYSDYRAIDAFLSRDNWASFGMDRLAIYGWPMVEAVDSVINIDSDKLAAATPQDLKQIGLGKTFQWHAEAARDTFQSIDTRFQRQSPTQDYLHSSHLIGRMIEDGGFDHIDEKALAIASRLRLAFERLGGGNAQMFSDNDAPDRNIDAGKGNRPGSAGMFKV